MVGEGGHSDGRRSQRTQKKNARWRQHDRQALPRLEEAGIRTANLEAGADDYVKLRAEWTPYILQLGHYGGYSPEEIDPAAHGRREEKGDEKPLMRESNARYFAGKYLHS